MIPATIKREHILQAVERIKREGVSANRQSVHYDLIVDGKPYPPKLVISIAGAFATGEEHHPSLFNAVDAKLYFLSRGYAIRDRRERASDYVAPEDDESAFPEGGVTIDLHRRRERDPSLSVRAKQRRLHETGLLRCEVCEFDFRSFYGPIGQGFIEAHHNQAVHTLDGTTKTRIVDLALVCSNCHRMLHRGEELLTVDQLKALVLHHKDT